MVHIISTCSLRNFKELVSANADKGFVGVINT